MVGATGTQQVRVSAPGGATDTQAAITFQRRIIIIGPAQQQYQTTSLQYKAVRMEEVAALQVMATDYYQHTVASGHTTLI